MKETSEQVAREIAEYVLASREDLDNLVGVQRHHIKLVELGERYREAKEREQ